jgi:DNA-binding transcriptional regulator LsrR (DeoR family)
MDSEARAALAAFYKQSCELSNNEIARLLRVDISSVSRYLAQAERNRWLVPRLDLRLPQQQRRTVEKHVRDLKLETAVRQALERAAHGRNIREIIVVSTKHLPAIEAIGVLAADFVTDVLTAGPADQVLGIAWGRTTHEMVEALRRSTPTALPGLRVVPLQGGLGLADAGPEQGVYFADTLAQKLAESYQAGSAPPRMTLPAYIDAETADTCDDQGFETIYKFMSGTNSFKYIQSLYETLNVAVVGIGGFEPEAWALQSGFLPDQARANELKAAGVCGDIVCRFYRDVAEPPVDAARRRADVADDDVHRLLFNINRRAIGITLDQIRRRTANGARIIGLAGGKAGAKARAVMGAMINGYVTDVVTDSATAVQLTKLLEEYADRSG